MQNSLFTSSLLDLSCTEGRQYLSAFTYPWEAVDGIGKFLEGYVHTLPDDYLRTESGGYIARDARVADSAYVGPYCVVGPACELRHGAYLRERVLLGRGCVVGNSTEIKNAILFDGAQLPHYNYVGDSIIGAHAHLGAGAIVSNLKLNETPVTVRTRDGKHKTGLRKLGAIIGDYAQIGAGAVLCPGSIVGRRAIVYPLVCVRGEVGEGDVIKESMHPQGEQGRGWAL